MSAAGSRYEQYLLELKREFPSLRVVHKSDSAWAKILGTLVKIATFGGQSAFVSSYVTTLGCTIYVPDNWDVRSDDDRYIVMRHEAVHLRQFRRYTFAGMTFLYLIPIFPLGLAAGRAWIEWEAYRETFRAVFEVQGYSAAASSEFRERVVKQFVGGAYGWMWPFPAAVDRWIDGVLAEFRPVSEPEQT